MNRDNLRYLRHELRTFLNHILGYSEILLEDGGSGNPYSKELKELFQEAQNLLELFQRTFYQNSGKTEEFEPQKFKQSLFGPLYLIIGLAQRLKQKWESESRLEGVSDLQKILESSRKTLELVEQELRPGLSMINSAPSKMPEATVPTEQKGTKRLEENNTTGKILVVDDNETNRDILLRHLERQGHQVLPAENGYRCLQALGKETFDLVLLDIMMPGMNGYQVLERMKEDENLRHIPVIMISALDEMDSVAHCISLGAEDYLPKSFNPMLLKARINSCLVKKQYRDQEQKYLMALVDSQRTLEKELAEAAEYVRGLLPPPMEDKIKVEWLFIPSAKLGGDFFDYHWLDEENLVVYLLDVSGHGIGAALLSVSVMNVLRSQALPNTNFLDPAEVLEALNENFQMENQNNMYFTIWYGVYNIASREINYASAGAPPAILVNTLDQKVQVEELTTPDMIIGVDSDYRYETKVHPIEKGSRMYLFSDGAYEVRKTNGKMIVFKEFEDILAFHQEGKNTSVHNILHQIKGLANVDHFEDDFSLLEIHF